MKEKFHIAEENGKRSFECTHKEAYEAFMDEEAIAAASRMLENRFTSKKSETAKERNQQTAIARKHLDFKENNGVVVCDFESCIPQAMYAKGSGGAEKNPRLDLIAIRLPEDGQKATLYLIEYKCNKAACVDEETGLAQHRKDMDNIEKIGNEYKCEILRRFRLMSQKEFGLLRNQPENLSEILQYLENDPGEVTLKKCFLFTEGEGLSWETVKEICEKQRKSGTDDDFCYLFSEDYKCVDLSQMKCWSEFVKSVGRGV